MDHPNGCDQGLSILYISDRQQSVWKRKENAVMVARSEAVRVTAVPTLKPLSYRTHTANQFFDANHSNAGIDIGHGVGDNQLVVMNERPAGINDIGNISLTLFLMGGKQWRIQAGDHSGRILEIKQYSADAILAHGPDAMGEHDPAFIGFKRGATVADLDEFSGIFRLLNNLRLLPEMDIV